MRPCSTRSPARGQYITEKAADEGGADVYLEWCAAGDGEPELLTTASPAGCVRQDRATPWAAHAPGGQPQRPRHRRRRLPQDHMPTLGRTRRAEQRRREG